MNKNNDLIRGLQTERLNDTLNTAFNSPFHAARLRAAGFTPGKRYELADLGRLPLLDREELAAAYPQANFSFQPPGLSWIHPNASQCPASSAFTIEDLGVISELNRRFFQYCKIGYGDVVQNCWHNPGLAAIRECGIDGAVLLTGGGDVVEAIKLMKDFGSTVLCAEPGFINYLVECIADSGVKREELKLKTAILSGEQWSAEMRARIETELKLETYDMYGIPEICGSAIAVECSQHDGMHVFEDYFYPEIINPESGETLSDGESGELVITTLCHRGTPWLRYRTGDITKIIATSCACGNVFRRIDRIKGRRGAIFVRGHIINPATIESALLSVEGTLPHYNIIIYRENGLDCLEVDVEITESLFSDRVRELESLQHKLADAIRQAVGIGAKIKLVAPRTINRAGSTRRIFDHRQR